MTTVAFLGLGAIGRPMAARLAAAPDISLAVWNRTAERARTFASETGARQAVTPADAARGADVVLTCFPVSADVDAVLDGDDGLLAGLARGALLVDCTSGDPATSRRIAARLAERGVGFLDAPVSGGTIGAEQGTLTVMVGGDAALLERARRPPGAAGQGAPHRRRRLQRPIGSPAGPACNRRTIGHAGNCSWRGSRSRRASQGPRDMGAIEDWEVGGCVGH